MGSHPPISISLLNDRFYLLPPAKFCKNPLIPFSSSSSPTPLFIFPNSNSLTACPIFPAKPLLCRAASTADTKTLPKSAIKRIAEKLRSLGYGEDDTDKSSPPPETNNNSENDTHGYSPGEIFVPLPTQLLKYRVGHTLDPSWSTPENPVPLPGAGKAIQKYHQLRVGAIKERIEERSKQKKEKVPTLAELTLPKKELRRLTTLGIALQRRLNVGKAGITEGIVNAIHERWRRNEVVKIRCEDICRMNMKRTHDLLERKTGGLVVWRSGTIIVLYRGAEYKFPYFSCHDDNSTNDTASGASPVDQQMDLNREHGGSEACTSDGNAGTSAVVKTLGDGAHPPLIRGVGSPNIVRFQLPGEAHLAEEADHLLEGLGPRFTDWWGYEPLPVDADLLPAVVPGYRKPFRLLPYGMKPILTNDEMTILKRLGRPLPCHFALGRNRRHQGLAAAIIKLWEKCEIAKIAIKRGVQNTNSKLMAEELKQLTGGTLLSRDKEFIVLYRGKDFLPTAVSSAIEERRKYVLDFGRQGETMDSCTSNSNDNIQSTSEYNSKVENNDIDGREFRIVPEQRHRRKTEAAIEKTSAKLSKALAQKATADKLLADLEKEETSQEPEIDKEGITEEERYMLRKVGLRMGPFLLLGRRGIFDGTIENMHLHWKYRELVKIITRGRSIEEIHGVARTLEAESGGILVAVERVSKGYAIIVYRGKNYSRPACLRPRSLLSKRAALKRSIEAQRRESLKLHVLKLSQHIDNVKLQLAKDNDANKMLMDKELRPELDKEQKIMKLRSAENEMAVASPDVCMSGRPSSQQDRELEVTNWPSADNEMAVASPEVCLSRRNCNQQMLSQTSASAISSTGARLDDSISLLSVLTSPTIESDSLAHEDTMSGNTTMPLGARSLSNKERLLLRKRALMLRKHPLFAIGKSNKITGLAEAIRSHFQKHPLAIVNVKGRARGTSVQEVVFKLEQATGAVLVSREPSKVILYRSWGAGEEHTHGNQKPRPDLRYSAGMDGRTWNVVSQELLSAIRLECGLQS